MNSEINNSRSADDENRSDEVEDDSVDDVDDEMPEETVVLSETQVTDNVGDVSVELNVEELIAEVEAEKDHDAARKKEIRTRIEELAESKSFEDTYAFDLDDKNL